MNKDTRNDNEYNAVWDDLGPHSDTPMTMKQLRAFYRETTV